MLKHLESKKNRGHLVNAVDSASFVDMFRSLQLTFYSFLNVLLQCAKQIVVMSGADTEHDIAGPSVTNARGQ